MEGQIQNSNSSGMPKFIIPTVVAALIVFAAIGFYLYRTNSRWNNMMQPVTGMMQNQNQTGQGMMQLGKYKNGTYSVTGNYVSPGGPRELNVTITLTDGLITQAETVGTATDATSKRFQGEFVDGFKAQVIGKNIDEVSLTKVAGSSLSPKGFNDAIAKVITEAKS